MNSFTMKSLLPLIVVIGLVGCASAPPLSKTHLQQLAEGMAKVNRCTYLGRMSPSDSADAQNMLTNYLKYQTYNQNSLNTYYQNYLNHFNDISQGECNMLSADIQKNKPTSSSGSKPSYRNTYCNGVGGYVNCSSFDW